MTMQPHSQRKQLAPLYVIISVNIQLGGLIKFREVKFGWLGWIGLKLPSGKKALWAHTWAVTSAARWADCFWECSWMLDAWKSLFVILSHYVRENCTQNTINYRFLFKTWVLYLKDASLWTELSDFYWPPDNAWYTKKSFLGNPSLKERIRFFLSGLDFPRRIIFFFILNICSTGKIELNVLREDAISKYGLPYPLISAWKARMWACSGIGNDLGQLLIESAHHS